MRAVTLCCVSLWISAAFGAEVYRSVDAQGNVVYSDRPQSTNSVLVVVENRAPAAAPAASPPQTAPGSVPSDDAADAPADGEPTPQVAAAAEAAQQAEQRAQNCATARDRSARYEVAHRLYREDENGERVYLDSDEIDAARAQAQADIATWCD